ncbi:hypothetical protein CP500_010950 [Tychonema bourrellyi FEM_GT703]|uniref:Uncharacterized protein n=1 Tax=Tychonema bourrellyi FEM_GT703 TaxID=2040638 RepID=A0A2G4F0T3_9CYAN|nr:hormogonium polysaccharide secretion pseudopilin HpsC [Tychonema bourrellyi]PHX55384.1 hypothetical protein CP500_010950 [Tychonema bourrellyi FEM_GT703]
MKTLLRLLLKSHHQRNRSGPAQTDKGMTLVELLVGSIMAFLIITPMLGFVVDMLNTDRREQVKSNTEQDLQAAVDFISQDLSQAIYIYDNTAINDPIKGIRSQLPENTNTTNKIPILVFWKRQLMKKSIPVDPSTVKPNGCNDDKCNDTYLLSLVAYYQFKDSDSTWCQPSGGTCPSRIARYEIRDGIKNPLTQAYYADSDTTTGQRKDPAFNPRFELTKPTVNVTDAAGLTDAQSGARNPQVLVNYIDHSPPIGKIIDQAECQKALGNPSIKIGVTTTAVPEATLKITDVSTHSFYACVDTSNNIARVTIRGNSLRRLQTDANYDPNKLAFFPTATVQVKGLSGLGK